MPSTYRRHFAQGHSIITQLNKAKKSRSVWSEIFFFRCQQENDSFSLPLDVVSNIIKINVSLLFILMTLQNDSVNISFFKCTDEFIIRWLKTYNNQHISILRLFINLNLIKAFSLTDSSWHSKHRMIRQHHDYIMGCKYDIAHTHFHLASELQYDRFSNGYETESSKSFSHSK